MNKRPKGARSDKTKAPAPSANWEGSLHQNVLSASDARAALRATQGSILGAPMPLFSVPSWPHSPEDWPSSAEDSAALAKIPLALRGSHWPQLRLQPVLKHGYRAKVCPRGSVQDLPDHGVVDTGKGGCGSSGQAVLFEYEPQIEGEDASSLAANVGTGSVRPGGRHVPRGLSGTAGHATRVATATGGRGARSHYTTDGVSNPHQFWQVRMYIERYRPNVPSAHWEVIGPFTQQAAIDAAPYVPYRYERVLSDICMHVHWCWSTAGLPLERSLVFHRDTIEEHIRTGCGHLSDPSRGNRRSSLLAVARTLLPPGEAVTKLTPLCRANPSRPYSPDEVSQLQSWALGQNTARRRRDAHTLLALGLGAGLSASEMRELRVGAISVDDEGVLVTVGGKRPRLVPVLQQWEAPLRHLHAHAPASRLAFGVERTRPASRNAITNFVARTKGVGLKPQSQRLRATWIVTHLLHGTRVDYLSAASGLATTEMIDRFSVFLPPVNVVAHRRHLRLPLSSELTNRDD